MKYNIDKYFASLQNPKNKLSSFVDFDKVINNVEEIQIHLNALNYLICNSNLEFEKRVNNLFALNKNCFKVLPILIAIRNDFDNLISPKNNFSNCFNEKDIIHFFYESKLVYLIFNSKIKNFLDYVYGIEVGLDTNARKNRNGKQIEIELKKYIENYFYDFSDIQIYEQKELKYVIEILKPKIEFPKINKKFDFIIINTISKKILLIESSFYNAGGSKISETSRSYFDLFKKIEEYKMNINFVWVADGVGMKTIKKDLISKYENNYITNINLLHEKLEWIKLD